MFLFLGCLVVLEGLALVFPMLLQGVTERVIAEVDSGNPSVGPIILNAALVFGFIILIFAITMLAEWMGAKYAHKYASNVRRKIFNKIQRLSSDTIENYGGAKLLPVLTNDTNWLRIYKRRLLAAFVFVPVAIFGSFIMMFMLNPWYGLIALGAIPFMLLFFWFSSRRMKKVFNYSIDAFDDYFVNVKEGITGARDIRILGKAGERANEFQKIVHTHQTQVRTSDTMNNFSVSFHALLFTAITIIVIIFGVTVLDMQETQQLVELNTAIQYIVRVQAAAHLLFVWFFEHFTRIKMTRARIQEVYDLPETKDEGGLTQIPKFAEPRLEFSNIGYSYENQARGLSGINLTVPFNTRVAISGGIGSGKSVIPRLLLGDKQAQTGEILLNQIDITSINTGALRRSVFSYAAPSPEFIAGTIRDNMRLLAPEVTDEDILEVFSDLGADDFISRFGDDFLSFELSPKRPLGDSAKNLLSIARAVLKPATIYVFNQCFEHVRTDYMDRLMTRLERDGKTALFITYDSAICSRCDNIYVLKNGRIAGEGTHAKLLKTNSDYQKFYASGGAILEDSSESDKIVQDVASEEEEVVEVLDAANIGSVEVITS